MIHKRDRDTFEELLATSQHVRDTLMRAVGKLDSYIEQLRAELDNATVESGGKRRLPDVVAGSGVDS